MPTLGAQISEYKNRQTYQVLIEASEGSAVKVSTLVEDTPAARRYMARILREAAALIEDLPKENQDDDSTDTTETSG